ncbi:MAG: VWA domain-containing protein [Firmicutes bacterium]|nr:VWA domain-containing protein [Bacillota bacterium]
MIDNKFNTTKKSKKTLVVKIMIIFMTFIMIFSIAFLTACSNSTNSGDDLVTSIPSDENRDTSRDKNGNGDISSDVEALTPIALAIVIQKSGGMGASNIPGFTGNRLDFAIAMARASLDALMPDDYVAVISFDSTAALQTSRGEPTPLNGMLNMSSVNRPQIIQAINGIRLADGTHFVPALELAKEQLLLVENLASRHILFFTNGTPMHNPTISNQFIYEMNKSYGITLSAVCITGTFFVTENMASYGQGNVFRVFYEEDVRNLPNQLFVELTRPELRNKD